jgi:CheY-like chemotaxis protein
LEPTDWDGRGGFPEIPPRLRAMAIAAVKSERGFLDDGSIGSEDRAVSIYVPIAPEDPPRRGPGETPWVAVVDDEEPMREIGSAVIREAGAVASSLESGEELLRRVGAGCRYRLVLLDLAMPGMDGAATYRALRELDRSAAVVLVSGADQPNRVRELLDEGVLGFLRKPFDVPRLLRIVHCALGSPAAPQELPK